MRIETSSLALAIIAASASSALGASERAHHALLHRRAATCQPCVCDAGNSFAVSATGSSGSRHGSGGVTKSRANAIAVELPPAKAKYAQRAVPRVKPSHSTLVKGATKAISNLVPAPIAAAVSKAFNESLAANTHFTTAPVDVVDAPGNVVFSTNATANNASQTAIVNIKAAIQDALNAATLAEGNLDAATKAQLQTCLNAILSNGGLPSNFSCTTTSGATSTQLSSTLRTVLEQFLGILPNKIIEGVFDAVMPQLTDLLPDEYSLVDNINKAIESVVASASGGSVTAIEQVQDCYDKAVLAKANTSALSCYTSSGAMETLQSSMNGVLQQFVGVLPANLITSVQNLVAFNLGTSSSDNVTTALNNAILSVGASLSGSTVTIYEQLEACANKLLIQGDATAAKDCTTAANGPAQAAALVLDSISEQFSGYLPSEFFTLLSNAVAPIMNSTKVSSVTKANIAAAVKQAFENSHVGPEYTGCFLEVQDCVVNAIVTTGNVTATCPGPVNGCQRIGASSGPIGSITSVPTSSSSSTSAHTTSSTSPIKVAGANAVQSSSSQQLVTSSATQITTSTPAASSVAKASSSTPAARLRR